MYRYILNTCIDICIINTYVIYMYRNGTVPVNRFFILQNSLLKASSIKFRSTPFMWREIVDITVYVTHHSYQQMNDNVSFAWTY